MPTISRFFGIVIEMRRRMKEHNPPHIHAIYNEYEAEIDLRTGEIIKGKLKNKQRSKVQEWVIKNKKELLNMWKTQEFYYVAPLE